MRLAVNYSPQAAELLNAGKIQVDLFKCPDWPDLVATVSKLRPVYVHFPLMAGRADLEKVGVEKINALLASTGTRYVNTHLAPRAADFGIPLDTDDPAHTRALVDAMLTDIAAMVSQFGRERVILENGNWDPNYDIPCPVIEPEIISHVVTASGCGFLLDIAHARMAAAYLDIDPYDYLVRLPVEHLAELHITGTLYDEKEARLVDHFPMTATDWALTEWAFERLHRGAWRQPDIVALEYGGVGPGFGWRSHADVLAVEMPRLAELIAG
ncbi:MAG TPA: DUF692 family protein [Phototrophicaceae bacterium]|nr:DUF692 family protein [Phototrophicaceae bacterium]